MKHAIQKIKEAGKKCSLCAARFEVWLDNSKFSDERKEKISQHQLVYCPVCTRADEK
jgi:hypothetical protein